MLDKEKINKIGTDLEYYCYMDFLYFMIYFVLIMFTTIFCPVFNNLIHNFGPSGSMLFIVIFVGIPLIISSTIPIGYQIFILLMKKGSNNFTKLKKRNVIIPVIQFGGLYLILLQYFPFKIIDLVIWIIILSLLIFPLSQSIIANIKLNYYCYESSEKLVINALTGEEIMAIAIFSFNLAIIFGLIFPPLLLLLYLKYPVKYLIFTRRKNQDFYKNLNLFYKIFFYCILLPLVILNIFFSLFFSLFTIL